MKTNFRSHPATLQNMKYAMYESGPIMPEYVRKRLLCLSEKYKEIADVYLKLQGNKRIQRNKDCITSWIEQQEQQNKRIFAKQFMDVSEVMEQSADTMFQYILPGTRKGKLLIKYLKRHGVTVKEARYLSLKDEKFGVSIIMKQNGKRKVEVKDLSLLLSLFFGKNLQELATSPTYLSERFDTYFFLEEPSFRAVTGIARAIKEGEKVSGDCFSIIDGDYGNMFCILSDGCGSGREALKESEVVIDFMERLLQTEFDKELVTGLLDNAMSLVGQEEKLATLDVCELDLYDGTVEFLKYGAADSFLKREDKVEVFTNDTFPLGMNQGDVPFLQRFQLQDSDMIVMVSDGVLDCYIGQKESFSEVLKKMEFKNPKEMANIILHDAIFKTGGKIADDCTVLVVNLWKIP